MIYSYDEMGCNLMQPYLDRFYVKAKTVTLEGQELQGITCN